MKKRFPLFAISLFLFFLLLAGCDRLPVTGGADGSRFTFQSRAVGGTAGRFYANTSDTAVIARLRAQLELPDSLRSLHPNGPIARGREGNLGWNWHFVPDEWNMAESSIEVCDGTPQMVEDDLDYWVDTVGRFCPWSAYVVQESPPD